MHVLWLIIPVAGFVMALVTRQRNPMRSTYSMIGFGVLAVGESVSVLWSISLVTVGPTEDNPFTSPAGAVAMGILQAIANLVGWAMIFLALFKTDQYVQGPPQFGGDGPYQHEIPDHQYLDQRVPGQPDPGAVPPEYPGNQPPVS